METGFSIKFADQAHEILASILDQSQDCIKLVTDEGRLVYMNPNGRAAMAVTDFGLVAGSHWIDFWPAECRDQVCAAMEAALAGRKSRFEGSCPTMAGEARFWDVSVSPVRDSHGTITHVLATSRDITPAVELRAEQQARCEAAEEEARLAREIAGEMKHRLKNLLAVVASINRLLVRPEEDAKQHAARLQSRIDALARAQDFEIGANLQVEDVVRRMLQHGGASDRIRLGSFPDARLNRQQVQTLALLLGELQTNALKHGALADADGEVQLTASRDADVLTFGWHERRNRRLAQPGGKGAGLKMIQRLGSVPGQQPQFEWGDHGMTVEFHGTACPADEVADANAVITT